MSARTYYKDRVKHVIPTGVSELALLLLTQGKRRHLRATLVVVFKQSAQFSHSALSCRTGRCFLDCKKENIWLFAHCQLNFYSFESEQTVVKYFQIRSSNFKERKQFFFQFIPNIIKLTYPSDSTKPWNHLLRRNNKKIWEVLVLRFYLQLIYFSKFHIVVSQWILRSIAWTDHPATSGWPNIFSPCLLVQNRHCKSSHLKHFV